MKSLFYIFRSGISHKKFIASVLLLILLLVGFIFVNFYGDDFQMYYQDYGYQAVIDNYKSQIDKYAKEFDLPASYLLAVVMLESSGRKYIKPRFEKHIYKKLLLLKKGKIEKFEDLTQKDLQNFSKRQLKDLAKSWGPFQIMGYKMIKFGVPLDVLKGKDVVYWSIKWIDYDYGDLLRQGRFKDAFHWHNTGKLYPQDGKPLTYDKSYVKRGLEYMRFFSQLY